MMTFSDVLLAIGVSGVVVSIWWENLKPLLIKEECQNMNRIPCEACGDDHNGPHTCTPYDWASRTNVLLRQILESLERIEFLEPERAKCERTTAEPVRNVEKSTKIKP
jgi:hypothetical protein